MPVTTNFNNNGGDLSTIYLTKERYMELSGTPSVDTNMTELWAFGANCVGQLGDNSVTDTSNPVRIYEGGNNWTSISASIYNSAGIKNDGNLWIWGVNDVSGAPINNTEPGGLLGIGTTVGSNRSSPVTTISGGTNWKQIALGPGTHAAIKSDGTLWTWGLNRISALGVSGIAGRNAAAVNQYDTPGLVAGTNSNYRQVSMGVNFSAAIKTDGVLWTWGSAASGKLANGSTTINRSSPQTVLSGGSGWKMISLGDNHGIGIQTDGGRLLAFGLNSSGQLGLNHAFNRSSPVYNTVYGGENWRKVSAGGDSSASIKNDGTLWTWGVIVDLGFNRSSPQTTYAGGTNWSSISVGRTGHYAAIKSDGTLWTWGNGERGQLGSGSTDNRSSPQTTVAGGTNWKSAVADYQFTVALKDKRL